MAIPIVDLEPFKKADNPGARENLIREIGHACSAWGAFQIVNHGIAKSLLRRAEKAQRDFFALPRSEKRAISRTRNNVMGYYDRELTKNTRDKKEVFDFRLE